jgi:hypothetical protein
MKRLLLGFLFLISFNIYAQNIETAYKDFYNSDVIDSNHCGRNIQEFLKYLDENQVGYKSGYVVSIHEPYAFLNHFDARWGSKEFYENGELYFRSNWYFHVFAVIDGRAYDFSQAGMKSLLLKDYLNLSYLPKSKTGNIFFQGRMTKESTLKKFINLEMNIYDPQSYRTTLGPARHQGVFIELFNL